MLAGKEEGKEERKIESRGGGGGTFFFCGIDHTHLYDIMISICVAKAFQAWVG